jgi:hypothetical protein
VVDSDSGVLVPPGDPAALAAALAGLPGRAGYRAEPVGPARPGGAR